MRPSEKNCHNTLINLFSFRRRNCDCRSLRTFSAGSCPAGHKCSRSRCPAPPDVPGHRVPNNVLLALFLSSPFSELAILPVSPPYSHPRSCVSPRHGKAHFGCGYTSTLVGCVHKLFLNRFVT